MKLNLIVATALNMGIGNKGTIPWRLKKDMALFTKMTKSTLDPSKKNAVIVGRKTWESIPEKNRPLADRINIILSTTLQSCENEDFIVCQNFEAALELLKSPPYSDKVENVWIIGGSNVYKDAMEHPNCYRIYRTLIQKDYECDAFMPNIDTTKFVPVSDPRVPDGAQEENGIQFRFEVYEKKD